VIEDEERCYRAATSKDPRFDGWFFVGVTTTGIYCRPSCPAMTPKQAHMRFYRTAAAAQGAGHRACKRCRPDATPGSPAWNARADLVGRAMRLIADGVVDRDGVGGLARRLGYSERHLTRQLTDEVGAGPLALARAQRAQTARILIETTAMPFTEVAFAAGFSSIRQFNDTVNAVFATTPSELRSRANRPGRPDRTTPVTAGSIALRLPYREPFDATSLFTFLGARAVPGIEEFVGTTYRRSLRLPNGAATVSLTPADGHVACTLRLDDHRDLAAAVQRCRRLLDLDADPAAVAEVLGRSPVLAPLVQSSPGRRAPGAVDGPELAVRAVLGQQVSVTGARTLASRLVQDCGTPLARPDGGLTHLFPEPAAIASLDPSRLAMPTARKRALAGMCDAVATGKLTIDPGVDRVELETQLVSLPGIGPWTAGYVAMRALGDPDAFLPTDLGIKHALEHLGVPGDPKSAASLAEAWRPWRSYALAHLWASLDQRSPT
jgi:AraC family transcriptional regulator of adaptative response / DNA-3-methyladenine glycosylase II